MAPSASDLPSTGEPTEAGDPSTSPSATPTSSSSPPSAHASSTGHPHVPLSETLQHLEKSPETLKNSPEERAEEIHDNVEVTEQRMISKEQSQIPTNERSLSDAQAGQKRIITNDDNTRQAKKPRTNQEEQNGDPATISAPSAPEPDTSKTNAGSQSRDNITASIPHADNPQNGPQPPSGLPDASATTGEYAAQHRPEASAPKHDPTIDPVLQSISTAAASTSGVAVAATNATGASDSTSSTSSTSPAPSTPTPATSSYNPYSMYLPGANSGAATYPYTNPYYFLTLPSAGMHMHPGMPIPPMPAMYPPPPSAYATAPPPAPPPSTSQQPPAPQADPARQTKPKRLKSHTVTTKNYSIPMVPRDKQGLPMLPLNVGIMTVISLGEVCMREGFHTERYIFPVGYEVTRRYLSTLNEHTEVVYHCTILDGGDGPKFQIVPSDAPDRPVIASTATGAWSNIVKQANAIRNRQHSNSVSGPDFFGLGQNTIKHLIQQLPNADKLRSYVWQNYIEGGPLGGRHAAVIPALPEEYDASMPMGAYYPRRDSNPSDAKRSYYPPHIMAMAQQPPRSGPSSQSTPQPQISGPPGHISAAGGLPQSGSQAPPPPESAQIAIHPSLDGQQFPMSSPDLNPNAHAQATFASILKSLANGEHTDSPTESTSSMAASQQQT